MDAPKWVLRLSRGLKASQYLRWPSWDRALGVHLAKDARVSRGVVLDTGVGGQIRVGERSHVHRGVVLATMGRDIAIGADCSLNPYAIVYGGASIGSRVRIAAMTVIVPMNHVFSDPTRPIMHQGVEGKGITIEDDVWVGSGVTVLDGVTIGTGCVIAAGSVVTRSTEPMSVYGGVPAKLLKRRGGG